MNDIRALMKDMFTENVINSMLINFARVRNEEDSYYGSTMLFRKEGSNEGLKNMFSKLKR